MKKLNRRQFAKQFAAVPVGLSAASALLASAEAAAPAAVRKPEPTGAEDNCFFVKEAAPFAAPLVFTRQERAPKLRFFALREVTLADGPLAEARAWNRAYMLRLPNDRLLHNFRVNAGLPSSAKPLGGWEAPHCELRGHFVGHYLSACALLYAACKMLYLSLKS